MRKAIVVALMILSVLMGFSSVGFAAVRISVGVAIPPPIVYSAPPQLVVIPGTYVYVAPDIAEDIFFYQGYWWRPWEGRWYRSRNYYGGWAYYRNPPYVLFRIPSGWRDDYRDHHWRGQDWNYSHIPYRHVKQNWNDWERSRHWEQPKYRQTGAIHSREQEMRGRDRDEGRGREQEMRGREQERRGQEYEGRGQEHGERR